MKNIYYILLTGLLLACGKEEETVLETTNQQEEIRAVTTINPEKKIMGEEIIASGVLSSKAELKLAFKTGGMIKGIYVSEGQYVKAGTLLATLEMAEIDAQVNQAKLGLQKAERDLERVKKLFSDEVATQATLDDATTGYDVAKEVVTSVTFNQKLSSIYAPQSGRILMKISEQGELITPFAPALVLGTGGDAFRVKVGLSDRDIVRVKIGNPATVTLDAYPNETFPAKITQIAQTVNPATGTYIAELTLSSKGKRLISGFVAKATITPPTENLVLLVPAISLVEAENAAAFVFVLDGETVEKRKIAIGTIYEDAVAVTSGLSPSDRIVNEGANFLSDKQRVKVVD